MKNYLLYFDKESLLKLMNETEMTAFQILQEIQPADNLDTSGRALTNNFTLPDETYIDYNNVCWHHEISEDRKRKIIEVFNEIGIKRLCEETDFSIIDILSLKLSKANKDQCYGWRRKAREAKKNENNS